MTYEQCRGDASLESWTIDGTDHFLEEKTSLELFSRITKWLLAQRQLGESSSTSSSSSPTTKEEMNAVEKQNKEEDATVSRIEFGAVEA